MEQRQQHTVLGAHRRQRALGLVQLPIGGEVTAVFVGIAVADHDLLRLAAAGQVNGIREIVEQTLSSPKLAWVMLYVTMR